MYLCHRHYRNHRKDTIRTTRYFVQNMETNWQTLIFSHVKNNAGGKTLHLSMTLSFTFCFVVRLLHASIDRSCSMSILFRYDWKGFSLHACSLYFFLIVVLLLLLVGIAATTVGLRYRHCLCPVSFAQAHQPRIRVNIQCMYYARFFSWAFH